MTDVAASFSRIKNWSRGHFPALAENLNQGVSLAELAEAEKALGTKLPESLRALYECADGDYKRTDDESRYGPGLFFGLLFLTLSDLVRHAQEWCQIAHDDPDFANDPSFQKSAPIGAIRLSYYRKGWIPFAYDFGGNYIGVDLDPGPSGKAGQVINFGRDESDKRVLANDVASFLAWVAKQLEAGTFHITEHKGDPDGGWEFGLAEPENRHFLDAIQKMSSPLQQ